MNSHLWSGFVLTFGIILIILAIIGLVVDKQSNKTAWYVLIGLGVLLLILGGFFFYRARQNIKTLKAAGYPPTDIEMGSIVNNPKLALSQTQASAPVITQQTTYKGQLDGAYAYTSPISTRTNVTIPPSSINRSTYIQTQPNNVYVEHGGGVELTPINKPVVQARAIPSHSHYVGSY